MIREVAHARPDAITVFCTNLKGAAVVEAMEAETGIRVHDTVSTAVRKGMPLACVDPSRIGGWGRLFSEVR